MNHARILRRSRKLAVTSALLVLPLGCTTLSNLKSSSCDSGCDSQNGARPFCSLCEECTPYGTGCGVDTKDVSRCGTSCEDYGGEPWRAADMPRGAIPAEIGTYTRGYQRAMVVNAEKYHWIIERHEWYAGGESLGPAGRRHVDQIATEYTTKPHNDELVVIEQAEVYVDREQTIDEAIEAAAAKDETRRVAVVKALLEAGVANAEERVRIEHVDRVGLRSIEAPQVFIRGISGGGGQGGQGGGGGFGGGQGGGFGGGGFGGGGIGLF